MDLENKFSYHFLEGLTLTEDGILTQGNEQIYIPPKELGVLIVLLESAGHVVLKDMIIESVWKNIIVSDEKLIVSDEQVQDFIIELHYLEKLEEDGNTIYLNMSNELRITLDY